MWGRVLVGVVSSVAYLIVIVDVHYYLNDYERGDSTIIILRVELCSADSTIIIKKTRRQAL